MRGSGRSPHIVRTSETKPSRFSRRRSCSLSSFFEFERFRPTSLWADQNLALFPLLLGGNHPGTIRIYPRISRLWFVLGRQPSLLPSERRNRNNYHGHTVVTVPGITSSCPQMRAWEVQNATLLAVAFRSQGSGSGRCPTNAVMRT